MTRRHLKISCDSLTKISISNQVNTQFFLNYCVRTTVLRQSALFSKKRELNFKGIIFSQFCDNIRNKALRAGKYTKLPRTADRAPGS